MNEARLAALYLIRRLTTESTASLAERYGGVSAAAISKSVARTEQRSETDKTWRKKLARLESGLRSGAKSYVKT
jgi:chromosomal replication initiation ATPase DnaA